MPLPLSMTFLIAAVVLGFVAAYQPTGAVVAAVFLGLALANELLRFVSLRIHPAEASVPGERVRTPIEYDDDSA